MRRIQNVVSGLGTRACCMRAAGAVVAASLLAGCTSGPEVVIENHTAVTIKADVQSPISASITGHPILGDRVQGLIPPDEGWKARNGLSLAPRQIWKKEVVFMLADASLVSPSIDRIEFALPGDSKRVLVTLTTEGRALRIVAVNELGAELALMAAPKETPPPPDNREPVFDNPAFNQDTLH